MSEQLPTEQEQRGQAAGSAWNELLIANAALEECGKTRYDYLYRTCVGVVALAARRYLRAVEAWQESIESGG